MIPTTVKCYLKKLSYVKFNVTLRENAEFLCTYINQFYATERKYSIKKLLSRNWRNEKLCEKSYTRIMFSISRSAYLRCRMLTFYFKSHSCLSLSLSLSFQKMYFFQCTKIALAAKCTKLVNLFPRIFILLS